MSFYNTFSSPPPLPSPPAPAYLYTDEYLKFSYGPTHPFRIWRLGLVHELIEIFNLVQPSIKIYPATYEELALFHDIHYLKILRELSVSPTAQVGQVLSFGLGVGDNPVFPGVFEWSALLAGASLQASSLVAENKHAAAFSMAGGMHHAFISRASGFCYINDLCLIIKKMLFQGYRIAYIDIDVHHGDGVQWAFYDSDQVITISLHQHPATLFPGTGTCEEIGRGVGRGYSINIPLWPDTDDILYIECFDKIVIPLIEAFKPDYIITQLGVDTFVSDPLANLNLTIRGFEHCLKRFREIAMGHWIAVGGGGYHVVNVAKGWALAWAIMLGRENELPLELPSDWCKKYNISWADRWLLNPKTKELRGQMWHRAERDAKDVIAFIQKNIFPIHSAKHI